MNIRKHHPLTSLPSFQRQNLLVEFAALKHSAPHGIYLTLTADPRLWFGFMHIRHGAYKSAVLKFLLSFPASYPALPPDLMLQTRVFHPLVDPHTGRFALEALVDGWSMKPLPPTPSGEPGNAPVEVTVVEVLEKVREAFEGGEVMERVGERWVVDREAGRAWGRKQGVEGVERCVKGSLAGTADGWMGEEYVRMDLGKGRDEVWRIAEEAREALERRGVEVREF